MAKKTMWAWGIGLAAGLYATLVLQQLWNWFLVPALNASPISFWAMYGLQLFVALLIQNFNQGWENDSRWEAFTNMLAASVPAERREGLLNVVEKQTEDVWINARAALFGKVVGYTTSLALGWVVHAVLI
jgi:hypothetical protein